MLYFEMCQGVWGGSPATEPLDGGIESVDLGKTTEMQAPSPPAAELHEESSTTGAQELPLEESTPSRREMLNDTLKNYKQNKLKCNLPADSQLVACAQEELGIK